MKSIIEVLRDYILTYPELPDGDVLVDYLGSDAGQYAISPIPCDPVYQRYTDGGCQKQYLFILESREWFSADLVPCMRNEQFYEEFAGWIEKQNRIGILPDLGAGKTPVSIEVLTGGYAFSEDTNTARYQIQLRVIYEEE